MWTRITSSDQLKSIGPGTLLLKYPTSGNAVSALDIYDRGRISVRYVTNNFPNRQEFDISLVPYKMEQLMYMISGMGSLPLAAVHKKYPDIISDGSYWIYNDKQA